MTNGSPARLPQSPTLSRWLLALLAVSAALVSPAAASSFETVWQDDFNGPPGRPDTTKWVYDVGSGNALWGNNEYQTYTSAMDNVRLDGAGHLLITARKEADGRYTSGRIKTKGRFSQKYGRFEVQLKIPRGPGLLPAFWLMGNAGQWPANGEIDVIENVGESPNTVFANVHAPGYSSPGEHIADQALADGFHNYAIEWTPGRIQWFFDGKLFKTADAAKLQPGQAWVFDEQPFYMILNVAIGGDWPGQPVDSALPQSMIIDWVKVMAYRP